MTKDQRLESLYKLVDRFNAMKEVAKQPGRLEVIHNLDQEQIVIDGKLRVSISLSIDGAPIVRWQRFVPKAEVDKTLKAGIAEITANMFVYGVQGVHDISRRIHAEKMRNMPIDDPFLNV